MNFFLLFFTLIATSLNAQVVFPTTDSYEKEKIHNSLVAFYADQLMQAGLFENEKEAKEAALAEVGQEQLDNDSQIFCLLKSENNEVQYGYLVYSLGDQTAYLDAIYLEERYQGKGFGKQVLHHFETFLLESEIYVLKLYVFDHNQRAIGLYNKIGYEIDTTYYINDKPIGHHMKKYLKKSSGS